MTDTTQKESIRQGKFSSLDSITEVVAWLQIVASPLAGGLIVGGTVYLIVGNTAGLIAGTFITGVALVIGVVLANKIRRTRSTVSFMARVNASSELDKSDQVSS